MQKGRKLWEKVLSLFLAVICCVGMINLSPLAEAAKAATTITFKTENTGITEADARIFVIEGTIASGDFKVSADDNTMTKGTPMTQTSAGEWTASVTSDVITFVRVSPASDGNYYWGWQWENTQRGNNTVYTATANGAGTWSEPSGGGGSDTGDKKTDMDVFGKQGTGYEMDYNGIKLGGIKDANGEQNTLISVAAVMYNYLPSGGSEWWDQFTDFDRDIITYYSGAGKMTTPLLTGAFGGRTEDSFNDNEGINVNEGALFGFVNNLGGSAISKNNKLWYYNHNLSTADKDSKYEQSLVGAPVQGMAAEYLSTDGELLSSENNVVMPFFDNDFLTGRAVKFGSVAEPISFPFRDGGNGYYVFDSASGQDNVYMGSDKQLVYSSSEDARIADLANPGTTGFYPFNTRGASTDYSKQIGNKATTDSNTNYGFGMRLDIPFNVSGKAKADTPVIDTTGTVSSGDPGWMTVNLGQTLQPGTYQLVLKGTGDGGFAVTQYKAGNSSSAQALGYFTNYKSQASNANWQSFSDIDGGREALINLSGGYIIVPVTVTEATNQISVYGKTWGSIDFGISVYEGSNTPVLSDDVVFNFSGDDDLWVYVDGRLALDIGGSHGAASGQINFTKGAVTVSNAKKIDANDNLVDGETYALKDWLKLEDDGKVHTLTVFYMERGLYDSNLKIEFNFTPVDLTQKNGITVSNQVDLSEINKGFLSNLSVNDFSFRYDAFDVNEFGSTGNKGLLFDDGEIVITGNGSQTASLDQDTEDGTGTIRGDEIKVTQDKYQSFDTSYTLTDTNGHEIMTSGKSGNDNPYNVVDGRTDKDSTADNYFYLENKVGCDCPNGAEDNLHLTAAYVNKAKATNITIGKKDNSVAHVEADTYTFSVTYSKLLGVEKTGFFNGEYTVTNKKDGTVRTETTANGEITIHEYEVVTIAGVPVDSEIKISEKNDGNFKQTIVTPSNGTGGSTIGNNIYFPIGSSSDVSYNWQIVNGDAGSEEYFAEVGTPIEINDGDEISLAPNGSKTTDEFTYIEEIYHPATAGTQTVTDADGRVTIPNDSGSYHDYTINLGTTLKAGQTYTVKLSGTRGDAISIQNVKIDGSTIAYGNSALTTEGDVRTMQDPALGNATTISFINGTLIYTVTPSHDTSNVVLNLKTWDAWQMDYEVSHVEEGEEKEAWTEYVPHVVTGVEYSYHEVISEAGKDPLAKGTVSNTDTAITYTYPAGEEPGTDNFYYVVSRIADADVVVEGNTVIKAGDVISTRTVPAVVYAYKGNDDVFVIDYGLPVSLTDEPNDMRKNDITSLEGVATELYEYGFIGTIAGDTSKLSNPAAVAKGLYNQDEIGYVYGGKGTFGSIAEDEGYDDSDIDNDISFDETSLPSYNYKLEKFMDDIESFYYGYQVVKEGTNVDTAKLNAANSTPVMNSKVTVVPATVVYYEDNFSYDTTTGTTTAITYTGNGVVVNSTGLDIKQSNSLDDLYGFDEAYSEMIGDGNGTTVLNKGQRVSFTFKGTGFDIVARTADTASVLYVVSCGGKVVKMGNVDTYYDNGVLYQLPVISVKDLEYNEYTVSFMISNSSAYSSFYFDGIRIYNPLNADASKDYYNSYENGAEVQSIQSMVLGDCTFTNTSILDKDGNEISVTDIKGNKIAVVDPDFKSGSAITEDIGNAAVKSSSLLAEILSKGPNNEVYLGDGSALAFYAVPDSSIASEDRTLQVEVKAVETGKSLGVKGYIDRAGWTFDASHNAKDAAKVADGSLEQSGRWTSLAVQTPEADMWFKIDMGKAQVFDTLELLVGTSTNDMAAGYEIYVSMDGENWGSPVLTGSDAVDVYNLGTQYARYILIRQTGSKGLYWSISEVNIARNNDVAGTVGNIGNADWTFTASNVSDANAGALKDKLTDGVIPLTSAEGVGNNNYRWTTGSKTSNQGAWLQLDMGKANVFDQIQLAMGGSKSDFPDTYEIYVSLTGNDNEWTLVKTGNGANGVDTYSVGKQLARYIKVVMPTATNTNYWSVYEYIVSYTGSEDAESGSGLKLELGSTAEGANPVIAAINTNTAMYYNIDLSKCPVVKDSDQADRYLVVLNGDSWNGYDLSYTNLKVKGYSIEPYEPNRQEVNNIYITSVKVNGNSDLTFVRKTEVSFEVKLSEAAVMNSSNFALTANGKAVPIRNIELKSGTSDTYIVKTLAPNAVGTFAYDFSYTNEDGKIAVTSVAAKVTVGKGSR